MPLAYVGTNDIERVYQEGDMLIVEGIAADTSRDIVGDMASKNFIKKLAADLPGRAVYYNHNYNQPQLGMVLDTKTIDNDNKLWAKSGIYLTKTNENIIKGLMDGSLRFYSVGAVGKKVLHGSVNGMPTRVFDDGYGQELTITGVPVNPTAAFRMAKSHGEKSEGYNDYEWFSKTIAEMYKDEDGNPLDILQERNRILQSMEDNLMKYEKADNSMVNPQYWGDHGQTKGSWDSVNPSAQKGAGQSDLRGVGGQLTPQGPAFEIRKAFEESRTEEEFNSRVEWIVKKASGSSWFGVDRLNGAGRGPGVFDSWGPEGGGSMARLIAQEVVDIVGKGSNSPNYGVHPWDAAYLRQGMDKVNFKDAGVDESAYIASGAKSAGPETLGPIGYGKNPGVHPYDQEFLKQGLQALPPAAKSNGYVHAGLTSVRKAQDLVNDERFMSWIHHSPYLYRKGQGDKETEIFYIHRLLHERGETEPGSEFRKAIDTTVVNCINGTDFNNLSIEDAAVIEHITNDVLHADVFYKCMEDPRCFHSSARQVEEDGYSYNRAMEEDEDEEPKKKGKKKGDDKDEDDDKKKGGFPFFKKAKDDEDEDEEEDEDEDEKKDDKKGGGKPPWLDKGKDDDDEEVEVKKSFNPEELRSMFHDTMRDILESDQAENQQYVKGYTTDVDDNPQRTGLAKFASDPFESALVDLITDKGNDNGVVTL